MRFQTAQVDAFAALSHDRSPLHVDPAYARRTPFGRPVVHGIAGALCALAEWAGGRPLALDRFVARFHRPLFIDEDYDLVVEGEVLELRRLGETHVALEIGWRPRGGEPDVRFAPFSPAISARNGDLPRRLSLSTVPYAPETSALASLGVAPDLLPSHQLAFLSWASYAVG